MRTFFVAAAALVVALAGVACDDDDQESFDPIQACRKVQSTFSACGGDPEGTWEVETMCHPANASPVYEESCDGARLNSIHTVVAQTLSFDGLEVTFNKQDIEMIAAYTFPPGCDYDENLTGCAGWETELDLRWDKQNPGNATCEEIEGACHCTVVMVGSTAKIVQAYAVEGDQVRIGGGDNLERYPFCQKGDEMVWRLSSDTSGPNEDSDFDYLILRRK